MWLINLYYDAFKGLNRYVWLLALANLINRTGSMVLPFMTLYLTKDLGIDMGNAGYAMSAYGIGSIIGSYGGGKLADRFHYKNIQVWSLLGSTVLLIPLIFLRSYPLIILTVFVFSIVTEAFRPANTVAIAAYSKPENRTRSFSLMRLAFNLGFSLGPAIGGVVAGTLGYKWLFLLDAVTCLLAALVLIFALPTKAREQKLDDEEKVYSPPSESVYKDKQFIGFIVMVALYAICFFQMFATVPVFFARDMHLSEPIIGLLLALNGALVVILEMPIVAKLGNYKRFMLLISAGTICMAIAYAILLAGNPWIGFAIFYTFMITLSEIFAMPFMMNFSISRAPKARQGEYVAVYSMAYGAAHILAPTLGLAIADHYNFGTLFGVLTVVSIILAWAFYMMRAKHSL